MPTKQRSYLLMWSAMAAVAVMVALAVNIGVRQASLFLSVVLIVLAGIRAFSDEPGPYGITVRSRSFDIAILLLAAIVIAGLAVTIPTGAL